jgi:RNA polymerase sigma-70 factor (ECF subfamily)
MVAVSDPRADVAVSWRTAVLEVVRATVRSVHPGSDEIGPEVTAGDFEDIRRTRDGDPDAYRRLVERHQDHVAQILWRFSRDRSVHEELVQDVFVEAYLSLNTYHGKAPWGHWLARIATRVGYRYWKERARQKAAVPFSLEEWDDIAGDDQMLERIEPDRAADILHRLLGQLPPRDRLVLTMRYIEGCDVAETARRTGWTKTMVKVQALRARNKLKRLVERSEVELM